MSSLSSNGLKSACLAFALGAAAPAMASDATDASAPVEVSAAAVRTIAFAAPIQGYGVNSRFGLRRLSYERRARMHEGLDYAAPSGTPILAAADGRVLRTGTSSSYGRFVEIQHANGVTSFYAHMSRIGQQINPENFLGQSFALQDVAPEADGSWDAPAFFASAPVAFGPFRTLTPAFQP